MTNHPSSFLGLHSLHTFLHFFPAEQSIGNSVTIANCFPNSHLLSSQIHLMLGFKKKKSR